MDEKAALRSRLRAARATRGPSQLTRAAAGIARAGVAHCGGATTVAAYASVRDEPPTHELLDLLAGRGLTVLLPVVGADGLDWAEYDGWAALADHDGLLEPTGDPAGPAALLAAEVVLAPALAVDRQGHRLGRGGGYYDRALVGVPRERIVAVVFADEVLDDLPVQRHDVPVSAALTPEGVVGLGAATAS
jgi:5-formyltetrahydrofolate cyclo-ligase